MPRISIVLILISILVTAACKSKSKQESPVPTRAIHSNTMREKNFLRADSVDSDRMARHQFLSQTRVEMIDRGDYLGQPIPAYLLNHRLAHHQHIQARLPGSTPFAHPASPIVHTYNWEAVPIDFSARFPDSFARNLPADLREALL